MTTPLRPDQLRISIEMGDDYDASPRLRAALDELAAALEEDSAEVEGYSWNHEIQDFRVFSFDSSLVPKPGGPKPPRPTTGIG